MVKIGIFNKLLICLMAFFLIGCENITKVQVMVGAKNLEFEFMKNADDIDKIEIQNIRDEKFIFIIIDKNAIIDIYDILSKGKIAPEKSDLNPDYAFTVYTKGGKIFKFNYLTGNFGNLFGNFYDDNDNIFYISDLLDKNIIDNFLIFRKVPRKFNDVYYNCIIDVMNLYNKFDNSLDGSEIAIDLNGDTEYRKFIFSNDINNFMDKLLKSNFNAKIYDLDLPVPSDIDLKIKTIGFDEYTYKCSYIFTNHSKGSKESYSLRAEYKSQKWNVDISKDEDEE